MRSVACKMEEQPDRDEMCCSGENRIWLRDVTCAFPETRVSAYTSRNKIVRMLEKAPSVTVSNFIITLYDTVAWTLAAKKVVAGFVEIIFLRLKCVEEGSGVDSATRF